LKKMCENFIPPAKDMKYGFDDNLYYRSVSFYYRFASLILGFFTIMVVVLFLIFGYREVTYDNIYYFVKDFDTVISSDNYSTDLIEYGTGENRTYHYYRGGVVAANKYAVSVYSATGRKTATFNNEYLCPLVRTSSKYMLIYDSEGRSFSVCNSFAQLYSETLDYPIYSADINNRGDLLIHSSTSEYRSVLYLYNNSFDRGAAYYFTDFIACSSISDDGNYMFCGTISTDGGKYAGSFEIYKRGKDAPVSKYSLNDCVPLKCGARDNGCYLVTDKGFLIFDLRGNCTSEMYFPEKQDILLCSTSSDGVSIVTHDEKSSYMTYISAKGDATTVKLNTKPIAVRTNGNCVYILYDGAVEKYTIENKSYSVTVLECAPDVDDILLTTGEGVYLCYSSRALYFEF